MTARERTRRRRAGIVIFASLASQNGCAKHDASGARAEASRAASSASAGLTTAPPSASAPSARSTWFAGEWTGTYRAAAHRIDLPTNRGGIPEWKIDDGKAYVGPGTVEIHCGTDGTVSGKLHGSLGDQDLLGDADDQSLHARILPNGTAPSALAGTLTMTRSGADVAGDLSASTADGRLARTATLNLTRSQP
jgi:hypothetical protein